MQPPRTLNVAFVLAERFTLSAFANFLDVLRLAADEADKSRRILCDWSILSHDMQMVRSSSGIAVQPDTRLRQAGRYDYIVVVGGLIGDEIAISAELRTFLQRSATNGTAIVGLCTGVFILQEAGLLAGYRCCVSWFHHQDFLDRFDTERPVSDQLFVVDRDRLTCSGGQGAAHLAAFLVSRHIGKAVATKSLNIMMIDEAMSGEQPQPAQLPTRIARDPFVRKAIHLMQQNLELPMTVGEIARELGLARRTLERRFADDLGLSPHKAYLDLRLHRAITRLRTTHAPIADIAIACGFCDASHLTRAMKAHHATTPAVLRGG